MTDATGGSRRSCHGAFWGGFTIGVVVGAAAIILVGRLLWSGPFG